MAKRRTVTQRARDAEAQLRIDRARLERQSIRNAARAQSAMLATYQAADRGRRNKDWRASAASADAAIIPDNTILIPRARQLVRDTSLAKSVVKAFTRNVVRCGIIPVALPRTATGELDGELAKQLTRLFWAWANNASACDAAREQSFWQMQSLAEAERVTAGEAIWVWSYSPTLAATGAVDIRFPVGLRLQQIEAEQLATHLTEYQGREVRGGIEVDEFGGMVAIHVYQRNPSDYLINTSAPIRIPAGRVLRYKRKDRVGQTRGVSDLVAVMQEIRDTARYKDAHLWRAIMEACIGIVIKRPASAGSMQTLLPRKSGDTGTSSSGMQTVDFAPGMTAFLGEGEDVSPFIPQSPGNGFEPFIRHEQRSIAAGVGIGYGQLTMDFTQGTYSGQRQEMLETRAEFEPLQELLAHALVLPVWRLFVGIALAEGRLDSPAGTDPALISDAEYVAPPMPWIDPEKELNAWIKAIEQKVITREEIAAMRGMRLADIWERYAAEQKMAANLNITLPENKDDPQAAFQRGVVGSSPEPQANPGIDPAAVDETQGDEKGSDEGDRNADPTNGDQGNADQATHDSSIPTTDAGVVTDLTLNGDQITAAVDVIVKMRQRLLTPIAAVELLVAVGLPRDKAEAMVRETEAAPDLETAPAAPPAKPGELSARADTAPNLRPSDDPSRTCPLCRFCVGGKCSAYEMDCPVGAVCDAWEVMPATDSSGAVIETQPVSDGEAPIDRRESEFNDRAARGVD